ncbi:MAG: hypothetical protein HOB68_03140 [Candidatus Marinimicrobia bacterium]|nr:hypothetical protein [Candidatus Neomarinimicrobiota bacterium]
MHFDLIIYNAGIYNVTKVQMDFEYYGPNYSVESGCFYLSDISLPPGGSIDHTESDFFFETWDIDSTLYVGGHTSCD